MLVRSRKAHYLFADYLSEKHCVVVPLLGADPANSIICVERECVGIVPKAK